MIVKLLLSVAVALHWECSGAFLPISSKTLDLSYRGLHTSEFFINLQHRFNIREVTELILRGNRFDSFLDCSTQLDNLRILDLSYNNLKKFFFLCRQEYNLTSLNVSHNQIEYISNEHALTHRVVKLKILDVSFNDLYVVNDTMLQYMKNLEFLSVASNPIGENIDAYVFQNLTQLRHLDLRNISSPYFSPALFEPLSNLEYLDLSLNPIEDVPPLPSSIRVLYICGTNILHIGAFVMPQLLVLSLDDSLNLTSVLLNNFENLTQLEILSMSDSPRLSQVRLRPMNWALLPKLKRLSLNGCGLESLGEELRPIIQKTAVIDLQNNPWRCDCRMEWIAEMNLTTDLVNSFKCRSPASHRDKLLHRVPRERLECEAATLGLVPQSTGRVLYPVLWSCLALLALGLFALGLVYYSHGCLGQWLAKMRHRGAETVSYTNVVESTNDLVLILPAGGRGEAQECHEN